MNPLSTKNQDSAGVQFEEVEIRGHIVDSLILPKVLDCILNNGGTFRIKQIDIGQARQDPSHAVVEVRAGDRATLDLILAQIADHGAVSVALQDCRLETVDIAGTFPEGFYSTTNQRTEVRLGGKWTPVADQEMDCGILVDAASQTTRCVPDGRVQAGRHDRGGAFGRARVSRRTLARPAVIRLHG